jgi:hypothetical protein
VSTPRRAGRDLLAIDEGCACTLGITLAIFSPIEGGMGLKDCTGDRAPLRGGECQEARA